MNDWETPQDFFDKLNEEFCFDLDVCATDQNAKCNQYYTVEDDGLKQQWLGTCWMNPPYGREIKKWMEKAHKESLRGATVVCLVPSRTDTAWWHDHAVHGDIRFLRGRLKFGGHKNSAPFPSAVVIFRPPGARRDERRKEDEINQETIDEIRRAINGSHKWLYDAATNALFVQPGMLEYREVAFPSELQSSIQAACLLLQHAPALLDEIERLTARVAELEDCRRTCVWRECDDFEAPGTYLTACGHYWSFTEGDRKDNSAVYCPYCGGKIEEDES